MISVKQKFKKFRKNRKIRREKPEIWVLSDISVGYIQIPKVATRSIRQCLTRYHLEVAQDASVESAGGSESYGIHKSQKRIYELKRDVFIFAFVRNPLDRLYSCYKNKVMDPFIKGGVNLFANHGIELGISFEDFVDIIVDIPDSKIDRHIRSQHWFLTYNDNLLPDYVGRLESFEQDWNFLVQRYSFPIPPHINQTRSDDNSKWSYYSRRSARLVAQRYEKDIELFNYWDDVKNLLSN